MDIYIISNNLESKTALQLRDLFTKDGITSPLIKNPLNLKIRDSNERLKQNQIDEISTFMSILNKNENRDNGILILKDTIVTNLNKDEIDKIMKSIETYPDFDICYLCKWMDRCDLLSDEIEIPGTMFKLAKTQMPNGNVALYISPKGKKKLLASTLSLDPYNNTLSHNLTNLIVQGKLNAITTIPNVFQYNYFSNNITKKDYIKTHECRPATTFEPITEKESNNNDISFLWFLFIVLGIIVISYIIIRSQGHP